jgi:hypothetical protein
MSVSEIIAGAVDKSVATVARAARRMLERVPPEKKAAAPQPRRSKGWRRHVRALKAKNRTARS